MIHELSYLCKRTSCLITNDKKVRDNIFLRLNSLKLSLLIYYNTYLYDIWKQRKLKQDVCILYIQSRHEINEVKPSFLDLDPIPNTSILPKWTEMFSICSPIIFITVVYIHDKSLFCNKAFKNLSSNLCFVNFKVFSF